jgi:hypothetical protein
MPPNYATTSARAHQGNVRVELTLAPIGYRSGFIFSLSPSTARALAAQLVVAADAAEKTTVAEKSTAPTRGD